MHLKLKCLHFDFLVKNQSPANNRLETTSWPLLILRRGVAVLILEDPLAVDVLLHEVEVLALSEWFGICECGSSI